MAFSGMINLKSGQLTLGGQFEAYKRGQLERNIHIGLNDFEKLTQFSTFVIWITIKIKDDFLHFRFLKKIEYIFSSQR